MEINIDDIKTRLLIKYPSFGKEMANVSFVRCDEISTAATDGERILYNAKFVKKLTSEEQLFLFAHEICHIALNHILRSEDKDKKIWNISTDAVINAWLTEKDKLPLIKGGVSIPGAIDYDAEELYNILLQKQQERERIR